MNPAGSQEITSYLTLRSKFIIPITATMILMGGFLSWFLLGQSRSGILSEFEKRAISITENFAYNSRIPLRVGDMDSLDRLLKGVSEQDDVVYAIVLDQEGRILATIDPQKLGEPLNEKLFPDIKERNTIDKIVIRDDLWDISSPLVVSGVGPSEISEPGISEDMFFDEIEPLQEETADTEESSDEKIVGYIRIGISPQAINQKLFTNSLYGIGITIILILIGIGVGFILMRLIIFPITEMADIASAIAEGNLSQSIEISSRDEIGKLAQAFRNMITSLKDIASQSRLIAEGDLTLRVDARGDLADSFNLMVDNLGTLVKRIKEASLQISTSSSEILASARQQEAGSTEQAASINETMATMEELSSTSRQIADNAESVARVADETLQAAEDGRKTLIESRRGMDEIRQNTQSIADRILRLNEKSKEIGAIVEMIDEIADKTDLLALNAALEGTKAGEAGKGFSLVAAEMRRLAESVVESTKEIKRIIREIQDATNSAVMTTEAGLKTTEAGVDLMKRTEDSLERIFSRIRETTDAAKQISFATQQQRSGTEQVVAALDDVSKVSKEAISGNKEATQSASELNELADELKGLVDAFKTSTG